MSEEKKGPIDRQVESIGFTSKRVLIVIVKSEAGLRWTKEAVASATGANIQPLMDILASENASMKPLFRTSEEKLIKETSKIAVTTGKERPDLSVYYRVEAPDDHLDRIVERLLKLDLVEAAYIKPPAEPAKWSNDKDSGHDISPVTPDFVARQGYLDPAPGGIDARYAWGRGFDGQNVNIIDIEGAWRFTHEDLLDSQGGVVDGTQIDDIDWRNHGTAVAGVIGGDRNNFGVTGISQGAYFRAISIGGIGSSKAIEIAADLLKSGDIILIELHYPGPRFNYQVRDDQRGYIPIEWWPDDFDAIKYATKKGIIVVEAAGNGGEDLDDALYNTRPKGFPSKWTNPFNRTNRDSGAILVGAGAPPQGTHRRDHGPDRSRLDFSNYGASIDAQGWGVEGTTCGYGDLRGGTNEDRWYTDVFGGTSLASPIVTGALACAQGALRFYQLDQLTPTEARQLLKTTGSHQQDAPGRPRSQRIGNRPDLKQIMENYGFVPPLWPPLPWLRVPIRVRHPFPEIAGPILTRDLVSKIDLYSDRGVLLEGDVSLDLISPLKNTAIQKLISLTKRTVAVNLAGIENALKTGKVAGGRRQIKGRELNYDVVANAGILADNIKSLLQVTPGDDTPGFSGFSVIANVRSSRSSLTSSDPQT